MVCPVSLQGHCVCSVWAPGTTPAGSPMQYGTGAGTRGYVMENGSPVPAPEQQPFCVGVEQSPKQPALPAGAGQTTGGLQIDRRAC